MPMSPVKSCVRYNATGVVLLSGGHQRMHQLERECPRCQMRVDLACEHNMHVHDDTGTCDMTFLPVIVDGRLWHDVCQPGELEQYDPELPLYVADILA